MDVVGGASFGLCEGELCCLWHRRQVSAVCLLCKICHRVDYPMNKYLKHIVAARNTRDSAALAETTLVILRCAELLKSVGRSRYEFVPTEGLT